MKHIFGKQQARKLFDDDDEPVTTELPTSIAPSRSSITKQTPTITKQTPTITKQTPTIYKYSKFPMIFNKDTWVEYCSDHPELPCWDSGAKASVYPNEEWFAVYRSDGMDGTVISYVSRYTKIGLINYTSDISLDWITDNEPVEYVEPEYTDVVKARIKALKVGDRVSRKNHEQLYWIRSKPAPHSEYVECIGEDGQQQAIWIPCVEFVRKRRFYEIFTDLLVSLFV